LHWYVVKYRPLFRPDVMDAERASPEIIGRRRASADSSICGAACTAANGDATLTTAINAATSATRRHAERSAETTSLIAPGRHCRRKAFAHIFFAHILLGKIRHRLD
jgi:hypothetical protein